MNDKIIIEVDLSRIRLGEEGGDLGDYIVGQAAIQLIANSGRDLRTLLADRVSRIQDEEIREAVRPAIAEAIERAAQPTDSFGNVKGEPRTLHEIIVAMTVKQLQTREGRFSSGSGAKTVLEEFIYQEVERTLRGELQEAVKEARAQVLAAVRDEGAKVITETIERMARS